MQKIFYLVVAYSPDQRRRIAVVGLSAADSSWLKKQLEFKFHGESLRLAIPEDLEESLYKRLFAEGIPEGCRYFLYRKGQLSSNEV